MCGEDSGETSVFTVLHFAGEWKYLKQGLTEDIVQVLNTSTLLQGPGCSKRFICNS